ncbi:FAD-dependent oxidoreductase [Candidatus Woesearchaeota archaeon]|nr:FAD-dependent oxidoreductase [Candidatus Woesearchaeota archaeon]
MKKVVIVGGGFAGAFAARNLQHHFAVTLIDTKNYFEFTPSILRTLVEPGHFSKIEIAHSSYLTKGKFLQGKVTLVEENAIYLNKQKISFDYLVLAMGSNYSSPIKDQNLIIASRGKKLREYAEHFSKINHIIVIGGGLVGVELAAEIITHFPTKRITIVHAKDELIERNPPRARLHACQFLEKRGVKIIWNERVISSQSGVYLTDKGTSIKSDLAFLCTGIEPNYHCLNEKSSLMLNERKAVCVNEFLQVMGHSKIFAAGDITSFIEEKTAQNAEQQAKIVVKNICNLEKNKALKPYISKPRPMIISLGKFDGIFVYKKMVFTGILPALFKSIIEWKTMRRYKKNL